MVGNRGGTLAPEHIVKIGPGRGGRCTGKTRRKERERIAVRECNLRTQDFDDGEVLADATGQLYM